MFPDVQFYYYTKNKLKFSQPHRKEVGRFDSQGNLIIKYESVKDAALYLNCHPGHISDCCNGKRKLNIFFEIKKNIYLRK
jgi:hypothetical protein